MSGDGEEVRVVTGVLAKIVSFEFRVCRRYVGQYIQRWWWHGNMTHWRVMPTNIVPDFSHSWQPQSHSYFCFPASMEFFVSSIDKCRSRSVVESASCLRLGRRTMINPFGGAYLLRFGLIKSLRRQHSEQNSAVSTV
jgi:hypothetical protein